MVPDRGQISSRIVAVITDFGTGDFYAGTMKAAVLSAAPEVTVIDISHDVHPHAVLQASFVLARTFEYFPRGTVFLAVVDPGVGGKRRNMIFMLENKFITAPDNGLISDLASERDLERSFEISEAGLGPWKPFKSAGRTFLGRDVLGPAAGALAAGIGCEKIGEKAEDYKTLNLPLVSVEKEAVVGRGRYIDRFGNIITNISAKNIEQTFPGMPLNRVRASIMGRTVTGISEFYSENAPGVLSLILNSWNMVEISVNQGSAVEALGPTRAEEIEIEIGMQHSA